MINLKFKFAERSLLYDIKYHLYKLEFKDIYNHIKYKITGFGVAGTCKTKTRPPYNSNIEIYLPVFSNYKEKYLINNVCDIIQHEYLHACIHPVTKEIHSEGAVLKILKNEKEKTKTC